MITLQPYDSDILCFYEQGGAQLVRKENPSCQLTNAQIQRRAYTLGLKVNKAVANKRKGNRDSSKKHFWISQGWNDILLEHYEEKGLPYVMPLIPRNSTQITVQTSKLGLKLSYEMRTAAHLKWYKDKVKEWNEIRRNGKNNVMKNPEELRELNFEYHNKDGLSFISGPAPPSVNKGHDYTWH